MNIKYENKLVIMALSVPLLMIVMVAFSIYLPGIFIKPKYDFLYAIGNYNYASYRHSVENHMLIKIPVEDLEVYSEISPSPITFYVYDVSSNTSEEISENQAMQLNLNSNNESPDGFEIEGRYGGGSSLFSYSGGGYHQYITGYNISKKLNIDSDNSYFREFNFIGWIE